MLPVPQGVLAFPLGLDGGEDLRAGHGVVASNRDGSDASRASSITTAADLSAAALIMQEVTRHEFADEQPVRARRAAR